MRGLRAGQGGRGFIRLQFADPKRSFQTTPSLHRRVTPSAASTPVVETGDRRLAQHPAAREAAELVHAVGGGAVDGHAGVGVGEAAAEGADAIAREGAWLWAKAGVRLAIRARTVAMRIMRAG